jgi:hypothetical protein
MAIEGIEIKTGATAPYKTLMYQYKDAADAIECAKIAKQILNDRQYSADRYEVDIIPTAADIEWKEGDNIHVHDGTFSLDGNYGIKDISFTKTGMTIGLGYPEITIFDLLGDKLVQVSGVSEIGNEMVFSGGWQNLSVDYPTDWLFNIADVTNISAFELKLAIAKWKTQEEIDEGNAVVGVGVGYAAVTAGVGNAQVVVAKGYVDVTIGTGHAAASAGTGNANVTVGSMNTSGQVVSIAYSGSVDVLVDSDIVLHGIGDELLCGDTETGISFGIVTGHLVVYNTGVDYVGWDLDIEDGDGTSMIDNYIWVLIPPGATGHYHVIPFTTILSWNADVSAEDDRSFSVWAKKHASTDGNVYCKAYSLHIMLVGRHAHTASDGGHSNHTITDAGHADHSDSDPDGHSQASPDSGHSNHSTNDSGHSNHAGSDAGHDHDTIDEVTLKGSYPSNVNVYIYNSTYPSGELLKTDAGGSEMTIDIGDITSKLADGENWISVETDTIGSGWLSGTFTSYGG